MANAQEIRPVEVANDWTGTKGAASDIRVFYADDPEIQMAEWFTDSAVCFRQEGHSYGDIRGAIRRALNALDQHERQQRLATAKLA